MTAACKQGITACVDTAKLMNVKRLLICGGEVRQQKLPSWCACYWAITAAVPPLTPHRPHAYPSWRLVTSNLCMQAAMG